MNGAAEAPPGSGDTIHGPDFDSAGSPEPTWSWSFQRVSGVLLVGLATLHFVDRFLLHDAAEIDAVFLSRRWQQGPWQLAEWAFLLLATAHGLVGLRWMIRRTIERPLLGLVVEGLIYGLTGSLFLVATWVLFTYG